jgi:glycosyltransferase involved in cell wall biosynthesis
MARRVKPGDWVYCVRQPMPEIYLPLVRAVHARGGKVAASWSFAPEFLPPPTGRLGSAFVSAVAETDAVISVAECTKDQFREVYGYEGPVAVVRYHNRQVFEAPLPLPQAPPYRIGFLGRIAIEQKNLDNILAACAHLAARRNDVVFNFYGGGEDLKRFCNMVTAMGMNGCIVVHGPYDHRRDLHSIVAANQLFVYASRFEGGPCFSLIELLQAGRYVVSSPVGGIPDIYAGRPDIGDLTPPSEPAAIAAALERALRRIERGEVDPVRIRAVYIKEFSEPVAHQQWLAALGLGPHVMPTPPDKKHVNAP